jgi:hypothetical protein
MEHADSGFGKINLEAKHAPRAAFWVSKSRKFGQR